MSKISCFIVDLFALEKTEDVPCDGLGAWSQSVTGKKYYKVHKTDSICNRLNKTKKDIRGRIQVICRPYTNKSDKSLKKTVVCISNSNGQFPLVFIKYQFTGPPHDIIAKPHGSSKNQALFYARTFRSTKNLLTEELEKVKPAQRAIFNVHESVWKNRNPLMPFQGEKIKHFTSEESSFLLMMILSTASRRQ